MASGQRSPPSTASSTTMRPPTTALLIYPVTLLVGSLFSILSPTARGSRQSLYARPASLAPSIAANVNLSPPNPVNYFARKDNIFNLYFVKVGWLWTTLAFLSLLVSQPAYTAPSAHQPRRLAQAALRYSLATLVWYLTTQWFFGPPIVDRSFVITGGKCERVVAETSGNPAVAVAQAGSVSAGLEKMFTAAACKAAGGSWTGGHDVSGHVFMLVLATSMLVFEAVGAMRAVSVGAEADKKVDGEVDGQSEVEKVQAQSEEEQGGWMRTWSLRLIGAVVGLGWWMLFMTSIWFHTWLEKWSGLLIALGTVYVVYVLPLSVPSWRDIVGIPGV
ncbi:FIT family protein CG10671 [Aspergillus lentulus]|uniref:Acyl-coenzyme A diphosphatase SCS3 n=1 Tax=Aspergillus lentulus TaxID=293939 RepID=A0ABQ0ZYB8_ASPLE|nr:FIT family protein CG10671 [Aspergillus lentulus]GFF30680.1 FIT family protein CG10671 [Aspergillus lentulus]GFF52356.1 FIT family protein CG10671 [Aspergillus lentulus]GFF68936.1 FIT family protein CG10671 [Aspergillus lentulus]GFF69047.1 FIT family protein CG10671 [Aspergillus lentulus]GFG04451.1 FIT family protein CG10671 [Aspergillus lentulus]